ncbi:MAG: hypothetical protein FK731_04820 [Asgard group archaeon]|nr:hypothetical protein [Asgard group archaeon]
MRPNRDKIIYVLVCLLSSTLIIIPVTIFFINIEDGMIRKAPITILGDTYFDKYDFPGIGTKEEPFIIENYYIVTADNYGIYIWNTTKYFIIQNCYIEAKNIGIFIRSAIVGTANINRNTCTKCTVVGISIENTPKAILDRNSCNENTRSMFEFILDGVGIQLYNSPNTSLIRNECSENYYGIFLDNSSNLNIEDNICNDNYNSGIYIDDEVHNTTLLENTCNSNTKNGITLYRSNGLNIENNTCLSNKRYGIELKYSSNNIFTNNIIERNNLIGLILINSPNNTVAKNSIKSNYSFGFFIMYSPNITIVDNIIANNWLCGIDASYSSNLTIINNFCTQNNLWGIILSFSPYSTIKNNTCTSNRCAGISLEENSFGSLIKNNTFENNYWDGINAGSTNLIIEENICNYNGENGIRLTGVNYSLVTKNTCIGNTENGIELNSAYVLVKNNLFQSNLIYGVEIYYGSHNIVHHNSFIDNLASFSQAFDEGLNNTWYDESILEGNYWSDWSGIGNYTIDGSAGSEDPYPLSIPPASASLTNNEVFINVNNGRISSQLQNSDDFNLDINKLQFLSTIVIPLIEWNRRKE